MNLQSKKYPTRSVKDQLIDNDIQELANEITSVAATIPSGGAVYERLAVQTLTGGTLVVGEEYTITDYVGGVVDAIYKDTNGTGYSSGTGVTTTGGSGTGLTVDITASGGRVSSVVIADGGLGYVVGDQIIIDGYGATPCYITVTTVLSDDFTNVGASVNQTGEVFIATGTTPADYSNGSTLDSTGSIITLDEVNPTPWLNKMYVNISSAQILAMGTTPIELLPAAGANKYYHIYEIILEYTHNTTGYTLYNPIVKGASNFLPFKTVDPYLLSEGVNTFSILNELYNWNVKNHTVGLGSWDRLEAGYGLLNDSVILTTIDSIDPTLGDGTLRAIITYTVRTFGA